jgi:hypothetical protein
MANWLWSSTLQASRRSAQGGSTPSAVAGWSCDLLRPAVWASSAASRAAAESSFCAAESRPAPSNQALMQPKLSHASAAAHGHRSRSNPPDPPRGAVAVEDKSKSRAATTHGALLHHLLLAHQHL